MARPVDRMVLDDQSRLLAAVTAGLERITDVPPTLVPAGPSVTGLFSCSQVELDGATPVFCAGTASGAVTLVSGQHYAAATQTWTRLRAGVEHRR